MAVVFAAGFMCCWAIVMMYQLSRIWELLQRYLELRMAERMDSE